MRSNDEVVEYVNNLRKKQGMSINELARETGLAKSSLSRYFNKTRGFPVNKVNVFAKALHVKPEDILGVAPTGLKTIDELGMHPVKIPIIGTIACGSPILADQNIIGYTTELFDGQPEGALFALKCQGDSMEPKIPDNATVIVRVQPTVEDDEIAAVLVDDDEEATLKRIKHIGNQVMLMPENTKYDPIILNKENPGRILGKVIKVSYDL
ncbi:XRE family transcriptional regulator [Lactobacillus helveticus]|uniref:ORF 221 n=1 Tax=Lactobacillus helveticus CIRM-BIA 951 TaxID=1226334 RepID=U6F6Y7_LACHE|nr:XRE family transcriptional regulator [Lactobacillus helveticus]MDY0991491.1 XRE family transcriptional regulator [Lactobacillus helveticus]MDY1002171.1 XRE family transcriptional regulator [Lactobacillus helveticus]MEB2874000.1 XRE family transcriptional regulator [Lactobacillus helveticus]TLQ21535.1 helix-turn-helix domain-containing protein [Lactobacillus helveticus]CDI59048.1 ORF 221 [Lactobacillus helveticus CIRM-BIA 951]